MSHRGGSGLDPRIIIPAILAQQRAAKDAKGIPLISDEEASRRQRAADAARRRRRALRRVLLILACVLLVLVAWLAVVQPATGASDAPGPPPFALVRL